MGPEDAKRWRPRRPNMLITGTPGTGKSTIAEIVAQDLGMLHIDVGAFARERDLVESFDDALDCSVLHEDAVLDALEPLMADGAVLLDHHASDWFPQRWVQAVVVLRTDTDALFDRLEARGYKELKLNNNVQAEIMQVVRDEALESYPDIPYLECLNNEWDDKDRIIKQVKMHYAKVVTENPASAESELK
jgi:adenylate kinase